MGVSSVYVNCTCNFHFLDIVGERYNTNSVITLRKNMVCCFLNKLSELGQFVYNGVFYTQNRAVFNSVRVSPLSLRKCAPFLIF